MISEIRCVISLVHVQQHRAARKKGKDSFESASSFFFLLLLLLSRFLVDCKHADDEAFRTGKHIDRKTSQQSRSSMIRYLTLPLVVIKHSRTSHSLPY